MLSNGFSRQDLHRVLTQYGPAHLAKQAAEALDEAPAVLPSNSYADPGTKRYPCNGLGAVWLSACRFYNEADPQFNKQAAAIEQNLLKAAAYWGAKDEVLKLKEKIAAERIQSEQELDDDSFAMVFKTADGRVERHLPLRNAVETVKAATYLQTHHDAFNFDERHKIATKVLEKAAEFGAGLGELQSYLDKLTGQGWCSKEAAAQTLWSRVPFLGDMKRPNELQLQLSQAAVAAGTTLDTQSTDEMLKLASVLDQIDRQHGLVQYYGEGLERPEDALFPINVKVAQAALSASCQTTSGEVYKHADFARIPLDAIRKALGDQVADAISDGGIWINTEKAAAVLPTLPRPDAELFGQVAERYGVQPIIKEAALHSLQLDPELLARAANAYEQMALAE